MQKKFEERDKKVKRLSIAECRKLYGIPKNEMVPLSVYAEYAKDNGVNNRMLFECMCVKNGHDRERYRRYLVHMNTGYIYEFEGEPVLLSIGDSI